MKPEPDPQSDGKPAKPRRSFTKDNRVDDALEKDLWDLDEPAPASSPDAQEGEASSTPEAGNSQDRRTPLPITPRSTRRDLVFKQSPPKRRPHPVSPADKGEDGRRSAEETADEFSNRVAASVASDGTFVDLDGSSEGDTDPKTVSEPAAGDTKPEGKAEPQEAATTGSSTEAGSPESTEAEESKAPSDPEKELSKGLSKVERMGLIGFLVLLVGGIIFFFVYTVNKLPDDRKPLTPADLPIAGQKISADKIRSYWREPNASSGETVRRGTLLQPVVELDVSGGPGAIRIFFRDSDGAIVGDGVTRAVNGKKTVTIAATAGFDDQGMFAAYRTGETKPWKIEIHEGPSENAAGSDFKKLFEIPISTQRR